MPERGEALGSRVHLPDRERRPLCGASDGSVAGEARWVCIVTCQLCRELGRIVSKVSYVPRFQKDPDSVFARSPDGLRAVNVAGLPVDVFAAMLREMEKEGDE